MELAAIGVLRRRPAIILYAAILICIAVFSSASILKHHAFLSTAWDLGIYEQVVWSTSSTGRIFWYTAEIAINPSCSFFGIHFSPILIFVVPIYWIFQSTETLLILQASVLALAAIPLYRLVLLESGSVKEALAFSLIYLAYPPINGMNMFDFHVQAFLPLLFFFAFYYFRKEEWAKYFAFIILALMVIEIVPLLVVFFGLYGLWINRKRFHIRDALNPNWLIDNKGVTYSIATVTLGICWFILTRVVVSAANPNPSPNLNFVNFGDPIRDLPGFVLNLMLDPVRVVAAIITPVEPKAIYLFGLFAPLAFLSFLSPPSLLIGAPWFMISFLSNYPPYYHSLGYQYVAFVAPFIFTSAIYGVKRLWAIKRYFATNERLSGLSRKIVRVRYWKALFVLCLFFIILFSYVAVLAIRVDFPVVTEHDRDLEIFVRVIPSDASVLTQNDLFPHIDRRLYVYAPLANPTGNISTNITFDHIFVDTTSPWYTDSLRKIVSDVAEDGSFGIQYSHEGILLLKEGYKGATLDPVRDGN